MTSDRKQEFTLRISKANKTGMITILYDMLEAYLQDAQSARKLQDREAYVTAFKNARACLAELQNSLDLTYPLARNYKSLYRYYYDECSRMAGAVDVIFEKSAAGEDIYSGSKPLDSTAQIISMVHKMSDAYRELEKEDTSAPLMQNTQEVYAGLTYGKTALSESIGTYDQNRGYKA